MKRQRRTLGLLLAGMSIALVAIGRQGQPTSQPLPTCARAANPASPAKSDALNRRVSTGSLARLVGDSRCSLGALDALRINAEEDGLSGCTDEVASRRARRRRLSWLWPAWAAYSAWDVSSAQAHASARAGGMRLDRESLRCGARLGWSGCMVDRSGSDRREGDLAATPPTPRRSHSPHRFAHTVARLARQTTSLLLPWPSRLAGPSEASRSESIRISRRPSLVAPPSAKPRTAPGDEPSSVRDLIL